MNSFHQKAQWDQQLSDDLHYLHSAKGRDENSPSEAIHWFFDYYDLDGAEENFWSLILAIICSDNLNDDSLIRHSLVDFYDQTISLFKAIYILFRRKEE